MRRTLIAAAATTAALCICASVVANTQPSETKPHVMVTPAAVSWGPGPASVPAGAQAAVIEGDPTKPGLFTLRLKMPDGYKIAPHYHPADEHVTVLQGTFVMGMGEKFDQSAGRELAAGSFAVMPTGTRHFAWTKGETIIQLHGIGPWGLTYVNPADDPRKKPSE
jgi:quercetin dioxygenase-like cupin family protein